MFRVYQKLTGSNSQMYSRSSSGYNKYAEQRAFLQELGGGSSFSDKRFKKVLEVVKKIWSSVKGLAKTKF